jgi:hypothetical protein
MTKLSVMGSSLRLLAQPILYEKQALKPVNGQANKYSKIPSKMFRKEQEFLPDY